MAENLRSAQCSPFVISKVTLEITNGARMRKLITARARKIKRTACMLANARRDHSIPINLTQPTCMGHKESQMGTNMAA